MITLLLSLLLIFMDTVFVYMLFQAKQQRNSNRLWRRWIMGTALAGEIIVGLLAFVESRLIPEESSPTLSAYSQPSSLT
ncbi:hypothetical protein [Armatimonas sp.]|uniref:hypothetical protein n=1 Tax=Armatimonas sp. TaxID=1872638 RepID=UPI003752040C